MSNELVKSASTDGRIARVVSDYQTLVEFVRDSGVMHDGSDYGKFPGTDKPSLWKPGAEKLGKLFGLKPKFIAGIKVLDWTGADHGGEPFFHYEYTCRLYHGDPDQGGTFEAEATRSCNSWESKYRWRWVGRDDVPAHLNADLLKKREGAISEFDFAIQKGDTSGKYGKAAEYWQAFRDAITNRTARKIKRATKAGKEFDAWETGSTVYRIPNDDIFSQVNTIDGMSQKRAYVAAMLIAVSASEFFTLDLEDIGDHSRQSEHVHDDGEVVNDPPPAKPAAAVPPKNGHAETPNSSTLPPNGPELHRRLTAYDAKLADAGTCKPGELLTHTLEQGVNVCGYPNDLAKWKGPAIQFAVDAAKDFVAVRSKSPTVPAKDTQPAPDGVRLSNWLREQGKELHARGGCSNEDDLTKHVKAYGKKKGWASDMTQWTILQLAEAESVGAEWLSEKEEYQPIEGEVVVA